MPLEIRRLPLLTQTAYARVLDKLTTGDVSTPVTLVSKVISGHRYWYAQRRENGKKIQIYLGRESPQIDALVQRWKTAKEDAASRAELIAIARAGGAYVLGAAEARVLEMLAVVSRSGAVLVGSHAFAVFGNMLGVRWQDESVRTEDVEIAHDPRIAVALATDIEPIKLPDILGYCPAVLGAESDLGGDHLSSSQHRHRGRSADAIARARSIPESRSRSRPSAPSRSRCATSTI